MFVGFCTVFCCKGKFYSDCRAGAGFRMYRTLATQVGRSLFDAQQTQAFRMPDIESFAVVAYRKRQTFRFLPDIDAYRGRLRMRATVVKSFLYDAIDAGF